jgi:hypothetical protein
MTDTLDKIHLALDVGHQITMEHIDHLVEEAEIKIDKRVHAYNRWGELRWFLGYLHVVLPPAATGYFPFEFDLIRNIARQHGVDHLLHDAMQELSPMGARMSLRFPDMISGKMIEA